MVCPSAGRAPMRVVVMPVSVPNVREKNKNDVVGAVFDEGPTYVKMAVVLTL
jgi:hypothetical protein